MILPELPDGRTVPEPWAGVLHLMRFAVYKKSELLSINPNKFQDETLEDILSEDFGEYEIARFIRELRKGWVFDGTENQ